MVEPAQSFKWNTFIEPIAFLISFSSGLSEIVLTDEILLKTCERVLEQNSTNCSSLSSSTALQEIVQPRAATILALKSFIENFVPAIVCIFFGSWCDVIGRKPVLLISIAGTFIYYAILTVLSLYKVNAYWYLAVSFFTSLLGGFPTVIMICYIYATDITNYGDKFRRLDFVNLAVFVGKLVGCLTYPYIVNRLKYCVVFTASSFSCLLPMIFIVYFLKETLRLTPENVEVDPWQVRITSTIQKFFQWLSLYSRDFLGFTLFAIALHDDNTQGTSTTLYLFAQQFHWNLFDFSIYTASFFLGIVIILLLCSPNFLPCLHEKKILAIVIGFISSVGSAFTKAFAKSSMFLSTALGVGVFSWVPQYYNRKALIDIELMPKEDLCKGFMATTALERIAMSFIIPINIYLCSNFVTTYPYPVWLIQASLQLVTILFIFWLFIRDLVFMRSDSD